MDRGKIVTGQIVSQGKLDRAKELRRGMTPAEQMLWQRLRANRSEGWQHFPAHRTNPYGFWSNMKGHESNSDQH